jgi:hypothetical protein
MPDTDKNEINRLRFWAELARISSAPILGDRARPCTKFDPAVRLVTPAGGLGPSGVEAI